ncbi:MAG: hypothetical protein QM571_07205 [Micrococcaceae bacterium]
MLDIEALMNEPSYVPVPSGDISPSEVFDSEEFVVENNYHVKHGDYRDIWRFCIMQALDIYEAEKAHHSLEKAKSIFAKPIVDEVSADTKYLDAGFTALAWYLANRDSWEPFSWMLSQKEAPAKEYFFIVDPTNYGKKEALTNPVPEFAYFGVLVHKQDLRRA